MMRNLGAVLLARLCRKGDCRAQLIRREVVTDDARSIWLVICPHCDTYRKDDDA
jgi:hypothetical protein